VISPRGRIVGAGGVDKFFASGPEFPVTHSQRKSGTIQAIFMEKPHPVKRTISKHSIVTGILAVGMATSLALMHAAFNRGDRKALELFAICSGVLCIAATYSFWVQAVLHNAKKRREKWTVQSSQASPARKRQRANHNKKWRARR